MRGPTSSISHFASLSSNSIQRCQLENTRGCGASLHVSWQVRVSPCISGGGGACPPADDDRKTEQFNAKLRPEEAREATAKKHGGFERSVDRDSL